MTILKIGPILETTAPRSKKKKRAQFRPPGGRKRLYVQLLEHWSMAKLVLKQDIKAHGPLFFFFVNMGPYGSRNCITLLLPKITSEFSQTSADFLSPIFPQSYLVRFLNLEISIFNDFFPLHWNIYGWKIEKSLLLPQIVAKSFQNFCLPHPHKVTISDFWFLFQILWNSQI